MSCTWKQCERDGVHPQTGRGGDEWALLCDEHHEELDVAVESMNAKKLLRSWALAGHGHTSREDFRRGAAEGVQAIAKLAQTVRGKSRC